MRATRRGFVVLGIIALITGTLHAGTITVSMDTHWSDANALSLENTGAQWNGDALQLTIWEQYQATTADICSLAAIGCTSMDPSIHIVKTVTNHSTFVWSGYDIVVSGNNASYIAGTAACDQFGTITEAGNTIHFLSPVSVGIGQSVTFTFDLNLGEGSFNFDIHQQPVPEPATLGLLGFGFSLLVRRRKAR